jgi:glutamine amidotransferase-like protein
MPGLLGCFGKTAGSAVNQYIKNLISFDNIKVGVEKRKLGRPSHDVYSNDYVSLVLYGHCFNNQKKIQYNAQKLLKDYIDRGNKLLDELDGAFYFVLINAKENRVTVINDRLGLLPLYWKESPGQLLIAPKIKYITKTLPENLDDDSLAMFLIAGYSIGDKTLHKDVYYLLPATVLTYQLNTEKVNFERYWHFEFKNGKTSKKELIIELENAINESMELLVAPHDRYGIYMSGGWDSRVMFGSAVNTNRKPSVFVTNGENDKLPFSDTYIAKKIARDYNCEYRFNHRDSSRSVENYYNGIKQCELITDSSPDVFGQHLGQEDLYRDLDFMLKGDEVWGWLDLAQSKSEAIGNVMPNLIPEYLQEIVGNKLDIEEKYYNQVNSLFDTFHEQNSWNEKKDLLYIYGRENRYIYGVGASDEEWIEVRRPLLTKRVLDVIAKTPDIYRVHKNLFIEMLKSQFYDFFKYGSSYQSSIPDYYYHMKPIILKSMKQHLSKGHNFNGQLDSQKILKLLEKFNPGIQLKKNPGFKQKTKHCLKDNYLYLYHRTSSYKNKIAHTKEKLPPSLDRIVFRLFLLLEYFYNSESRN